MATVKPALIAKTESGREGSGQSPRKQRSCEHRIGVREIFYGRQDVAVSTRWYGKRRLSATKREIFRQDDVEVPRSWHKATEHRGHKYFHGKNTMIADFGARQLIARVANTSFCAVWLLPLIRALLFSI